MGKLILVLRVLINRKISAGEVDIRNAEDYYNFCKDECTAKRVDTAQWLARDFILVGDKDEIDHDIEETDVPATRRIHQVECESDYVIKTPGLFLPAMQGDQIQLLREQGSCWGVASD